MNKTLCILPQKFGLGGPASFLSRLAKVLSERGYILNHDALDPTNSAILVIGGTRQIRTLRQASQNGVRIVQRLNGMNWVHRRTRTGLRHFLRAEVNNWILSTIRGMADQVIYQSEFSRDWWSRVHGETKCRGQVIYNGVDLEEFTPLGAGSPPRDQIRILMVEGHLGGGYEGGLRSAVQMAQLLDQRSQRKTELMVVGQVPESLQKIHNSSGVDIFWRGVVKREEIPAIDRTAHLLYSSDVNAACPNSVVEALACGLPVISYDTGALPELVTGQAGSIARYGSDPWKLQKPDIHTLADAAREVIANQETCRKAARAQAVKMFDIQKIADQYLEVLLGQ